MKTIQGGDDLISRRGMCPSEFDRCLVRLGTAITEENFALETPLNECLGKSPLGLDVPGVGYVNESCDLIPDRFDHLGRRMSDQIAAPSSEKIEISVSLGIPNL